MRQQRYLQHQRRQIPTATWTIVALGAMMVTLNTKAQLGQLDIQFGDSGIVHLPVDSFNIISSARDLCVQSDGKIVIAGSSLGNGDHYLVRTEADGTLDPTFGIGGSITHALGSGTDGALFIELTPDGKLVTAGNADTMLCVARFTAQGQLDTTFNSTGAVLLDLDISFSARGDLIVDADGAIFILSQLDSSIVVECLDLFGQPVSSFATNGRYTHEHGYYPERARAMVLRPNGKLLVAGYTQTTGIAEMVLFQLDPGGTLDPSFGTGGEVTRPATYPWDVCLTDDGDAFIAASDPWGTIALKFLSNGTYATGFGAGGYSLIPSGGVNFWVGSALARPDESLVMGGFTESVGIGELAIGAFTAPGEPDTSLCSIGRCSVARSEFEGVGGRSMVLHPNEYFYVCGDGYLIAAGEAIPIIARFDSGLGVGYTEAKSTITEITAYPNPADETFAISAASFTAPITVEIIDASGRLAQRTSSSAMPAIVDVTSMQSGFYSLVIGDTTKRSAAKLVIQH